MALDYGALLGRAAGGLVSFFSSLPKITVKSGIQRTCSWYQPNIFPFPFKEENISRILKGTFQA